MDPGKQKMRITGNKLEGIGVYRLCITILGATALSPKPLTFHLFFSSLGLPVFFALLDSVYVWVPFPQANRSFGFASRYLLSLVLVPSACQS